MYSYMATRRKILWVIIMASYPLYSVEDCSTFSDFLIKINVQFGDSIAFCSKQNCWIYRDFYHEVLGLLPSFPKNAHYFYVISVTSPYKFAAVYFSVIISGNVAVLADSENLEKLNIQEELHMINDENICNFYCEKEQVQLEEYKTDNQDLCTIACSSGTTSVVKGVMLSQENLLSDMVGGMRNYKYAKGDKYVNILPYTHLFGIIADLLGPLSSGGVICFSYNRLDFFHNLRYFQPTNLNLPPALVNSIFDVLRSTGNFEFATGGNLRQVMCAGASMNDNVNTLFEKYGMRVYAAYGLTECSPCVTLSRDRDYRVGSCGKTLDCCQIRIENEEVLVCGKNVMLGYYKDSEATNLVLENGWLHTGDLGYLDEDGFLFIYGRKTNLIVFESGYKLLPELLESKINRIKGIKESVAISRTEQQKVRLDIMVVIDDTVKESKLKEKLRQLFGEESILEYVENIHFTQKQIPKNKLGKIVRSGL